MTSLHKKVLWIVIITSSFFCCSCVNHQHRLQQQACIAKAYRLAPFSSIVITGNAKVKLVKGCSPTISLEGQKLYVDAVNVKVINNTLHISNAQASPVNIKVQTAHVLRNIAIEDNAYLVGGNFAAKRLKIYARNNAGMTLNGVYDIANITQAGRGKIEIKWVESCNLEVVNKGTGPIYLAGTVNCLEGKLFDGAHLEARYLRAQQVTILATNHARADVLAIKALNVYADHRSNVFYYKRPLELNKVTKDSGNLLLVEELR